MLNESSIAVPDSSRVSRLFWRPQRLLFPEIIHSRNFDVVAIIAIVIATVQHRAYP